MRAQGMPPSIRNKSLKRYIPFSGKRMHMPKLPKKCYDTIADEGINLLNLHSRNKAINVMWLKDYLNMSPIRPTWACCMSPTYYYADQHQKTYQTKQEKTHSCKHGMLQSKENMLRY
jgi:hypothetical protein